MYAYPEMPLEANVWFDDIASPPTGPADARTLCSISPLRPNEYFLGTFQGTEIRATHIIRTGGDARYRDNFYAGGSSGPSPCTVFEVPVGSGHFYAATWCHVVGAGFPNEHARIYAARVHYVNVPPNTPFIGWI